MLTFKSYLSTSRTIISIIHAISYLGITESHQLEATLHGPSIPGDTLAGRKRVWQDHFSNSLIIPQVRTNEIITVNEVLIRGLKPWSNGPASSRKWPQVELGYRLALGGQTDWQVSSQVLASHKKIY